VVFVDGDFWHGNPKRFRLPNTNRQYWSAKILRNYNRDRVVTKILRRLGRKVVRIWESSLRGEEALIGKLKFLM
jgi:DNA mismatch endonuclease (patch repair protein)